MAVDEEPPVELYVAIFAQGIQPKTHPQLEPRVVKRSSSRCLQIGKRVGVAGSVVERVKLVVDVDLQVVARGGDGFDDRSPDSPVSRRTWNESQEVIRVRADERAITGREIVDVGLVEQRGFPGKIQLRRRQQVFLDVVDAAVHAAIAVRNQTPGFEMIRMEINEGMDPTPLQHIGDGGARPEALER